jgi:ankyrin repeat protein
MKLAQNIQSKLEKALGLSPAVLLLGALLIGSASLAMNSDSGSSCEDLLSSQTSEQNEGDKLCEAALAGDLQKMKMLLARGVPVDARYVDNGTPLVIAAYKGHRDICQLLLERKAQVNAKDNLSWTALRWAVHEDYKDICQLLIDANAQIDTKGDDGWTPLACAAAQGHKEVCLVLLDCKAQVDAKDNGNWTPLTWAAFWGNKDICQLLLDRNAQADAKDNHGDTPLTLAAFWGSKDICLLLIDEILKPIKRNQAIAIALLGIKRFHRNAYCIRLIDKQITKLIACELFMREKQNLFAQINAIENEHLEDESNGNENKILRNDLCEYVRQQLKNPSQINPSTPMGYAETRRASPLGPSINSGQATSTTELSNAFTTELCRSIHTTREKSLEPDQKRSRTHNDE